jgi:hypothetical protein
MQEELITIGQEHGDLISLIVDKILSQLALWGVLLATTGLVIAFLVMAMIHRRRWLRRTPVWWNVVAKSSYLLVLVALPLAGAAGGALFGVERLLLRAVDDGLQPLLQAKMPAFRASAVERFGPTAAGSLVTVRDLVQPLVQGMTYTPRSDSFVESFKARVVNEILLKRTAVVLTELFQERIRSAGKIGELIAKDWQGEYPVEQVIKFLSGAGEHMDFSDLDKTIPDVVCQGVRGQIGAYFKGFYLSIGLSLLAVAILIAGEMLFYFKRYLPRTRGSFLPQSA